MAVFNFPYHYLDVEYPESSVQVSYGRGYQFASAPRGPDQVTYILNFDTMVFFESPPGVLDLVTRPTLNMGVLEAFYNTHKLYLPFEYPHPVLGNLDVRFAEPLKYRIKKGGRGATEPFSLKIITLP